MSSNIDSLRGIIISIKHLTDEARLLYSRSVQDIATKHGVQISTASTDGFCFWRVKSRTGHGTWSSEAGDTHPALTELRALDRTAATIGIEPRSNMEFNP